MIAGLHFPAVSFLLQPASVNHTTRVSTQYALKGNSSLSDRLFVSAIFPFSF